MNRRFGQCDIGHRQKVARCFIWGPENLRTRRIGCQSVNILSVVPEGEYKLAACTTLGTALANSVLNIRERSP